MQRVPETTAPRPTPSAPSACLRLSSGLAFARRRRIEELM
jgi:hypothetical protein